MSTSAAGMNPTELASLLYDFATRRAAHHGVVLGPGADSDIRERIRMGAASLLREDRNLAPNDPIIQATRAGIERLIDEMVRMAITIPGYQTAHPGVIGEQTFAAALASLCPLFPFC